MKKKQFYMTPEELFDSAKGALLPQINEEYLTCPYCGTKEICVEEKWMDGAILCSCYQCNQLWAIEPTTRDKKIMEMI